GASKSKLQQTAMLHLARCALYLISDPPSHAVVAHRQMDFALVGVNCCGHRHVFQRELSLPHQSGSIHPDWRSVYRRRRKVDMVSGIGGVLGTVPRQMGAPTSTFRYPRFPGVIGNYSTRTV